MSTLDIAFKEWAVVCRALAEGRQSIILRKGGIAEPGGVFRVEHDRFWLYPTWAHQQEGGVVVEARPLLEQVRLERPPAGRVRLTHFAVVGGVYHIDDESKAQALAGLHLWSPQTVRSRFHYRTPGLFVLAVRIHRAATPFELEETARYAGCKSWVELSPVLSTTGATPVLDEKAFDHVVNTLDLLLQPTMRA